MSKLLQHQENDKWTHLSEVKSKLWGVILFAIKYNGYIMVLTNYNIGSGVLVV